MPVLKISNVKNVVTTSDAKSSNVSSSVSGNIDFIQSQLNMKTNNYINIKNAVKILENYSNWNGYIKLYSEVESNFEVDDIVYITYTDPNIVSSTTFNLENPSVPFENFYVGYKILYTNKSKNEIVINRYYNDITKGYVLKNQYLSKISCRGGTFYGDVSDGVVYYNCNILNGSFGIIYGIISGSTISGAEIICSGLNTFSDSHGNYTLSIPSGSNIIKCRATGYITKTLNTNITANIKQLLDIQMTSGSNSITIYTTEYQYCSGDNVNLTSNVVGYDEPVYYQWKVNNSPVGLNSSIFSFNCTTNSTVTCTVSDDFGDIGSSISNEIFISIIPPSIEISSYPITHPVNTIHYSETVTFHSFVSCYINVVYKWKVNNIIVGNDNIYTTNILNNNDKIVCEIDTLTGTVESQPIYMTVL